MIWEGSEFCGDSVCIQNAAGFLPGSQAPTRRGRSAQYPFVTEQMEGQRLLAKFRLRQLPN